MQVIREYDVILIQEIQMSNGSLFKNFVERDVNNNQSIKLVLEYFNVYVSNVTINNCACSLCTCNCDSTVRAGYNPPGNNVLSVCCSTTMQNVMTNWRMHAGQNFDTGGGAETR